MRIAATIAVACVALAAAGAEAQDVTMTTMETAVACAPPPILTGPPDNALHVIGSQDTMARRLFGMNDLLVVNGGTKAGVRLNQRFFVRRANELGAKYNLIAPGTLHTVGWIKVVAVNDTTAIATVEHACDGIFYGDYLDTFAVPRVPAGADRNEPVGEPNFSSLARVLVGNEDRVIAGTGDFMLIDRGTVQGVALGSRFAVYRDVKTPGMPLAAIGEAIVVSVGPNAALSRVTSSHGAIVQGDYVAFRRNVR